MTTRNTSGLPRPAWLGDFTETVENFVLATANGIEQIKVAAFRKYNVARISAPNRIFTSRNDTRAAAAKIDNRNFKSSAAAHVECDFLFVRRPIGLGAITVAGRNRLAVPAAG